MIVPYVLRPSNLQMRLCAAQVHLGVAITFIKDACVIGWTSVAGAAGSQPAQYAEATSNSILSGWTLSFKVATQRNSMMRRGGSYKKLPTGCAAKAGQMPSRLKTQNTTQ